MEHESFGSFSINSFISDVGCRFFNVHMTENRCLPILNRMAGLYVKKYQIFKKYCHIEQK